MGTFSRAITLSAPSGGLSETVEGLVDTGATFTFMPESLLERLGVRPQWRIRLGLADGHTMKRGMGEAVAEIDGETRPILCVFSDDDSPTLIGAHTLEAFLLTVDPIEQKLVKKDALRMQEEVA